MDNHSFDLVKMLHLKLDSVGRMEKYCIDDAKAAGSECAKMIQDILTDERKHVDWLKKDLKSHL